MAPENIKGLVNDMKNASPDILRRTAKDVFEQKIKAVKDAGGVTSTTHTITPTTSRKKGEDCVDTDETSATTNITDSLVALEFSPDDRIPKFDERDITIGRVMGRGAFCCVKECNVPAGSGDSIGSDGSNSIFGRVLGVGRGGSSSSIRVNSIRVKSSSTRGSVRGQRQRQLSGGLDGSERTSVSGLQNSGSSHHNANVSPGNNILSSSRSASGSIISETGRRARQGRYKYVLKQLSPDLVQNDKISYLKGVVDLAMETHLLSSIDHENIVGLYGMASGGPFEDGYFVILEKINDTLSKKVKGWMDMDRQCKGITGVFTGSKKKQQRLQTERISAAFHLAQGMNYLHARKTVFRDLKPDNVGFDYNGVLKIFDFGLARECLDSDRTEGGLYRNMTACTGAVRYMSPENASGKPYGLSTDVYAYAMILWLIFALEPPFSLYTEKMILERVCERGYRPKLFSSWSPRLSQLIHQCWSENPHERPSFSAAAEVMRQEMGDIDPKFAEILEEESESATFLDKSGTGK
eukprot:CAMPEP_0113483086 /NCGR_PEP_ID=MMETSP0014_2-20120614/23253_1 /TAXON_ID=2857 /ORGANISM="Nitzschia sp." /LENGTH=522 /DNA_ID=CAMNT_0000376623 /DNA_START=259 /DNA_END=1827 /DNA_ORIENTATION=- /assembly_acc=CAM_ASM_000159